MAREGYCKTDIDLRELWSMLMHSGVRKVLKNNLRHGLKEQGNSLCKSFPGIRLSLDEIYDVWPELH
ncbi:hypothetical protein KRX19_10975 [Cardiobacteriaceae bacterium TAE3-ERU3]|nr:hypothetical protein [Cardiobacteriaceae bacterium TAE3-ERU3]